MLTRCSPVFDVILLLCFLPSQSYFISIEAEFEGLETSAGDLTVQQLSQERSINYMYDFFSVNVNSIFNRNSILLKLLNAKSASSISSLISVGRTSSAIMKDFRYLWQFTCPSGTASIYPRYVILSREDIVTKEYENQPLVYIDNHPTTPQQM